MSNQQFSMEADFAHLMDSKDELANFRREFNNQEPDMVYMDGNSLGRLPQRTIKRIEDIVMTEWGKDLIRSWGKNWYTAPLDIGNKIGQLVGADPDQVIVSDSTSVNLYKLVMSALDLRPDRSQIVSDELNFPSDLYILQGCIRMAGNRHHLHLVPSEDGISVNLQSLYEAIDENTALVTLSHVVFKSGFLYDAASITEYAHKKGALVIWDLSHSAGSVPIELDKWDADMATGCTYKYLNGGPGSPAFLYVRKELQAEALSPIWGWFGENSPFSFDLQYTPAEGIKRFVCGTPPTLSLLAMESGIDLTVEAGMKRIREKSILLTSYMIYLYDEILKPQSFTLGTPRDVAMRGSHVSIRHPEGYQISQALIEEMNVIPDFREPDNIRLGLAPLYTSFADVWVTIDRIRQVIQERRFEKYSQFRSDVT
jgi:kynureninase